MAGQRRIMSTHPLAPAPMPQQDEAGEDEHAGDAERHPEPQTYRRESQDNAMVPRGNGDGSHDEVGSQELSGLSVDGGRPARVVLLDEDGQRRCAGVAFGFDACVGEGAQAALPRGTRVRRSRIEIRSCRGTGSEDGFVTGQDLRVEDRDAGLGGRHGRAWA